MKNEKLELMLNKVVEYLDPKGTNFKAFLYKNSRGYYFKVVEILKGDMSFNDIIYLKDGDEKFLVVASKPKLMRVSKKSWHYRLLKYILKSNAPTPQDMQNGCPYFWLVMFSLLALPFVLLYKAVKWVVLLIPKILFWVLKQLVTAWIAGLDDEAAYELNYNGSYSSYTKMPKTAKIFFDNSDDDDFFTFFLSKKYKVQKPSDPAYAERQAEIKAKWEAWRKDLEERRAEARKRENEREAEARKRKAIHDKKRAEAQARWEAKMRPFRTWRKNTAAWFKNTFTVERGRINMIVKRTKQFFGAVVTLLVLAFTFVVVNYTAVGLTYVVDAIIAGGWKILVGVVIAGAAIGILYLLWVLISSWGQAVVNKYKRGKRVWYVEPLIYLVWYPVKYLALAIAFVVVKIIWAIIKFLFYTLLFKWFLKPIGLFIAKVAVGLVKGIGSSSGIFGEYFGASYSDYCPGLEWVDFDDED
jgi:hypothetical protein